MAAFKDLALRYVLADEEKELSSLAESAAREIESSNANSTVVGNWASSIQQWIAGSRDDMQVDDGEEAESGDVIARAKALGFLAATLEALNRSALKADQIQRLVAFFGSIFSYDHKAGITAATKALRELYSMKNFKPDVAVKIISSVTQIKDDFRLQTAATRLQMFTLIRDLVQDPPVKAELQKTYGAACEFVVNLLQLAQNERDPQNLLIWFDILKTILAGYSPSPEIAEEIFKAFSAYFPITLRGSATSAGVTPDDLKGALRACFSAHESLAPLAFPYLLQKLDQGDAVTVSVKVDILKTINACIDQYAQAQDTVVPYTRKLWDSLKYEVRNGEAKDTIDATLDVLKGISNKLQKLAADSTGQHLTDYIDMVIKDCSDDLSNSTYTKQSGLLINAVITANTEGLLKRGQVFITLVRKNLSQPKSPSHRKDLVSLLNLYLKSRSETVDDIQQVPQLSEASEEGEGENQLRAIIYDIYLPIWRDLSANPDTESTNILKEVIQGMALLVSQKAPSTSSSGEAGKLLLSQATCDEICSLLSLRLVEILTLSANDNANSTIQDEAVLALRMIVTHYTDGFGALVEKVLAEIQRRSWAAPSAYSLGTLRDVLTKLAFIGCSEIPKNVVLDKPAIQTYSALQHFTKLVTSLTQLILPPTAVLNDPRASAVIIGAIHCAMLNFRDACNAKYDSQALKTQGKDEDWIGEFKTHKDAWFTQLVDQNDLEAYHHFLKSCLYTIFLFYQQADLQPPGISNEVVLSHIARMATFVVRHLDEGLQKSCRLAENAFSLFHESKVDKIPNEEFLTLGILEGLWPAAMTSLYTPNGIAQKYICDIIEVEKSSKGSNKARAAIGAILSNKYPGGPKSADPDSDSLVAILRFWSEQLTSGVNNPNTAVTSFEIHSTITLYILAGAIARMDRRVIELVPRIHEAVGTPTDNGQVLASSIQILAKDIPFLSVENHAVVKPIYKQWLYNYVAKPLYEKALPPANDEAAARYTTAILAIVEHCPFSAYEADLPQLIRLLITTICKKPQDATKTRSDATSSSQAAAALHILLELLAADSAGLTEHLNTLVTGAVELHANASRRPRTLGSSAATSDPYAIPTRRLALQLLGALPGKYEERYLLAHSPRMQQMLATATGDPVREVRRVARSARESWFKIV
ncbi:hypothetical protein GQ53DRAFT_845689 [Thozetella sp. PMI_491]|nr:hypothetical protein GQ53DRAFT_845689 [Thozetella sp. PMI_491]